MFSGGGHGDRELLESVLGDGLVVFEPLALLLAVAEEAVEGRDLAVGHDPQPGPLLWRDERGRREIEREREKGRERKGREK